MRRNRARRITTSLACAFVAGGLLLHASAQDGPPPNWESECNAMRSSEDPGYAVTYRDWPETAPAPAWAFTYRDVPVAVPVAAYDRANVTRGPNGWEATLHDGTSHILTLFLTISDTPMTDVWASAGVGGEVFPTAEGEVLTATLFGGPVTIARLIDLGYQHTPRDLTCAPEAWRTELAAWLVLTLKAVATPGGDVYRAQSGPGWVLATNTDVASRLQRSVPGEGAITDITVALPAGTDPLAYAVAPTEPAPDQPEWLAVLEAALADGSDEAVAAAVEAMRAAGLTVSSTLE